MADMDKGKEITKKGRKVKTPSTKKPDKEISPPASSLRTQIDQAKAVMKAKNQKPIKKPNKDQPRANTAQQVRQSTRKKNNPDNGLDKKDPPKTAKKGKVVDSPSAPPAQAEKPLIPDDDQEFSGQDILDDSILPKTARRQTKAQRRAAIWYAEGIERGLPPKRVHFAMEYVKDFNAARAARDAGYGVQSAASMGSQLLTHIKVKEFVQYLHDQLLAGIEVTNEWILREYENMAKANILDFVDVTDDGLALVDLTTVTRDQAAGLAGLEIIELPPIEEDGPCPLKVKIKLADKKAALDVLAKRAGLLKEDTVNVNVGGTLKVDAEDTQDLAKRVAFILRSAAQKAVTPNQGEKK